jgi:presenilin-like A22 family membrane protease
MRKNLSPLDRDVRIAVVLPLALIVLISSGITTVAGILAAVIASVMLLTSLTGYDPIYELFGDDVIDQAAV